MKMKFTRKIELNGKTYMGDGEAAETNRVFPGWAGDAPEGESYVSEWAESAIDDGGHLVSIIYQFDLIKGGEPDPDRMDWDNNIAYVRPVN